mmetsp:Transcript_24205/g.37743  ORF Transcript_24205/g.37743 Transcript_24205/m.37743 type:complete len:259 (-) Transcript_24205:27-803(-)
MQPSFQSETVEDIENSLFTLMESQRKVEELLSQESDNDELQRIKRDIEMAIEDLKNRMHVRRVDHAFTCPGEICEILWSNDVWYAAVVLKRMVGTVRRIGLLGYGIEKDMDTSRMRKKDSYDWKRGMKCLVLEGFNAVKELYQDSVTNERNVPVDFGQYKSAVIDTVLTSEREAWVMFLDSKFEKVEGKPRKVTFDFLEQPGKQPPQDDTFSSTGAERKNRKEKGAKKRERYIKKQEASKKKLDDSFRSWKSHFCKKQ